MKKLTFALLTAGAAHFLGACNDKAAQPPKAAAAGDSSLDASKDSAANKDKAAADKTLLASRDMSMEKFDYPVIHFSYDSSEIPAEARAELDKIAKHLANAQAVKILIAGHCDERGTEEYNLALGENRAKAVRKYLSMMGVSPDRLDTISFGKAQPVAQGDSEEAYAQNRRAEFKPKM